MQQYLNIVKNILEQGDERIDRTGTGTKSVFGRVMRYNLQDGFPLLTTRKMFINGFIKEFEWMVVKGSTDVTWLQNNGVQFWNSWVDENNTIGHGYGEQFRRIEHFYMEDGHLKKRVIDQVEQCLDSLRNNPWGRRHIITLYNPHDMDRTTLPCCHGNMIQFYCQEIKGEMYLSCSMYQRSCDIMLGVPTNIAFYALMLHVFSKILGYKPLDYFHIMGDTHIYLNHIEQAKELIKRHPLELPKLKIHGDLNSINDFHHSMVSIEGYKHYPPIKMQVSV